MSVDHSNMRLGWRRSTPEQRVGRPTLSKYFPTIPTAPPEQRVTPVTAWPVYCNQDHACCTVSALAHMVEVFSQETTGTAETVSDSDILAFYGLVDGGQDAGADEITVLQTWRKTPLGSLSDSTIDAFAALEDLGNLALVKAACWLFSGLYIGIALPLTAQTQEVWDVAPDMPDRNAPGSWGGHAVSVIQYDAQGVTVVTWGAEKRMTWEFWRTYVEEAYAVLPTDFQGMHTKLLPCGFDYNQLQTDLLAFGPVDY